MFKSRCPRSLAKVIDYWIEHEDERKLAEDEYLKNAVVFEQEECMNRMEEMMQEIASGKKETK